MTKHFIITMACVAAVFFAVAQHTMKGIVLDSLSQQPVIAATVMVSTNRQTCITDDSGRFVCAAMVRANIIISAAGFETKTISFAPADHWQPVQLCPAQKSLATVVITGGGASPYKALMETAIAMRGVANSQEVLRMVPGLFIAQHQGGGKAEQIFLRGFDADHGHDINIAADGLPVNMLSHAHGQGYADSHFIIPETIENATFNKGPYDAEKGDMATAGYLEFHTFNTIKNSSVKLEAGQFGTFRSVALIDLLPPKTKQQKQSWYAAAEYSYTNGYFDNPEHFKRLNVFTKYSAQLSPRQQLSVSLSSFYSSWLASGQIPERAVEAGLVGYFGAIDPEEGGVTSRTNVNVQLQSTTPGGSIFKNQFYFSNYHFDLHSNFSFFLEDKVNGDEIRQREGRNLFGYNGGYQHEGSIGGLSLSTRAGIHLRMDIINNSSLLHTINRYTLINTVKLGDIDETVAGLYLQESLKFSAKWQLKMGIRADKFFYRYKNKTASDSNFPGEGVYRASNHIVSPKLSLYYEANANTQWYCSLGKGFHSNDARVVVSSGNEQSLPAVYAADLGFIIKPLPHLLLQAAAWYSFLQKEFVYAGDGGTVEFSGRTRRIGIDFSGRYQAAKYLFLDLDLNYAHGRSLDEEKGRNFIPEAPVWSSSAGITFTSKKGFNAAIRYRYLARRPANEDYSLACQSYFVNDLVVKYRKSAFEYAFTVNNLFNVQWRETELEATTQLKTDSEPVNGISFTPGTKFCAKVSVTCFF
ncbi:MAG TPA: TonB-dependent receptor [Chitinophagaceae bacterium]|nr:TonB-dependent receptor [Chitinophagaceae bacterium]